MNLSNISLRNMRVRLLSTTLTTISIMLGTALIAVLWLIMAAADNHYKASGQGYRAIVGAKEGSPMTLVVNTVLNLAESPGPVPMSTYKDLHEGPIGKKLGLRYAIPQARGDTFEGFPIIGTTDDMFTKFRRGGVNGLKLQEGKGRYWKFSHEDFLKFAEDYKKNKGKAKTQNGNSHAGHNHDHSHAGHSHAGHSHVHVEPSHFAVIGSKVEGRLRLNKTFIPTHGAAGPTAHQHVEDTMKVVGILEPTGTPLDRSIFVPLSGFLSIEGHDPVRDTGELQLSAIIVDTRDRLGGTKLRYAFQTRPDAQVAWTHIELARLFQLVGGGTQVLRVVSWLVLVVAALLVLVALYNTMNERRREIAIMRSLGARRSQILSIILLEAMFVSVVGAIAGILLCHGAALALGGLVEKLTSVPLDWAVFDIRELFLVLGVGLLGSISGILPAVKGARTPVAENLAPTS